MIYILKMMILDDLHMKNDDFRWFTHSKWWIFPSLCKRLPGRVSIYLLLGTPPHFWPGLWVGLRRKVRYSLEPMIKTRRDWALKMAISSSFVWSYLILPSGKRLHNYGKSPFSIGKSTINGPFSVAMLNYHFIAGKINHFYWAMFNSKLLVITRGYLKETAL